ncbi:MAG: hypothetical protein SYC29_02735 [Planctomycetota bacterium]|nr:hypothetical protein [Planctomycetota bacterium]
MLRRLRQEIRLIGYYSANRPRTGWTRAAEWALVVALILAVPAMLLCEALITRTVLTDQVQGLIVRGGDAGSFVAVVQEEPGKAWWPPGEPYGEFFIEVAQLHRGWPFTTSITREPARLDLNVFAEQGMRRDVQLPADAPLRKALERALAESGEQEKVQRRAAAPAARPPQRTWLGSIVGTAMWWMILTFVAFITIRLMQFATMIMRAQHAARMADRLARGRCPSCGYDLRGLEFNERCPECGTLLH